MTSADYLAKLTAKAAPKHNALLRAIEYAKRMALKGKRK